MKKLYTQTTDFVLRLSAVRFGLVSLAGETLYFILYGLVYNFTKNNMAALAISGGLCIAFNSYVHARFTFRIRFNWGLLCSYLFIQLIGFAFAFIVGLALEQAKAEAWLIALLTYVIWAGLSFLLTRAAYRTKKRA
jgi:hypothetical protein